MTHGGIVHRPTEEVKIMSETPPVVEPDAEGSVSVSTGTRSAGRAYENPGDGPVNLILNMLDRSEAEDIEIAAFAEDASELSDEVIEYYDLPEGTTKSLEDLFDISISGQYAGGPPTVSVEDLTDEELDLYTDDELTKSSGEERDRVVAPEVLEAVREQLFDRHATIKAMKIINGFHNDKVADTFGDGVKVTVGKARHVSEDWDEAQRYVRFYTSEGENADYTIAKARLDVGTMAESEFNDWCRDNGYEEKVVG